jgi:hypothetical protein
VTSVLSLASPPVLMTPAPKPELAILEEEEPKKQVQFTAVPSEVKDFSMSFFAKNQLTVERRRLSAVPPLHGYGNPFPYKERCLREQYYQYP